MRQDKIYPFQIINREWLKIFAMDKFGEGTAKLISEAIAVYCGK